MSPVECQSSSILTGHPPFSGPLSTSRHYLLSHPPSKVLPATPGSSSYNAQHITEEIQTPPPVVPHVDFAGKSSNKIVSGRLLFYTIMNLHLDFLFL